MEIINGDSLEYMDKHKKEFNGVITSIPDMEEALSPYHRWWDNSTQIVGYKDINKYIIFFRSAVVKCLNLITDTGYCIFILTDRKCAGTIPKDYYCIDEAYKLGLSLVSHKISYVKTETNNLYRPLFSHILVFTRKGEMRCCIPDVFSCGDKTYSNGTGEEAVRHCIQHLKKYSINDICDPFLGEGMVLKVAKEENFIRCVGVDIDIKQVKIARKYLSNI